MVVDVQVPSHPFHRLPKPFGCLPKRTPHPMDHPALEVGDRQVGILVGGIGEGDDGIFVVTDRRVDHAHVKEDARSCVRDLVEQFNRCGWVIVRFKRLQRFLPSQDFVLQMTSVYYYYYHFLSLMVS